MDTVITNDWKEGKLNSLIAEYALEFFFSIQARLDYFSKFFQRKKLTFKGYVCNGEKKAEQELTIFPDDNMTCVEKRLLIFIEMKGLDVSRMLTRSVSVDCQQESMDDW